MSADKPHIVVYLKEWHLSHSDAFHDMLFDPLQSCFSFQLNGWDGVTSLNPPIPGASYLFCQLVPPPDYANIDNIRVIWLPMWDHVQLNPQTWWDDLPKSLYVVAFSEAVARCAKQAGLRTLRLHYYKNPELFEPSNWSQKRVLLYWNRVGLVGPDFLARLCEALKVDKLLLKADVDPGFVNGAAYDLPSTLGRTTVECLPVGWQVREEFLQATHEANLFIAPRRFEGAGMTFLEAMARGCAVFAYNGATMNEYITSGEDGYLFKRLWSRKRIIRGVRAKLSGFGLGTYPPFSFKLQAGDQDWKEIAALDVQKLGETARLRQQEGYRRWQSEIPQYVRFLRDAITL